MNSGKLFISFWNVCLDNLPEGTFRRRRLASDEAKACIEQARKENKLLCVSNDDLLAPHQRHEKENHEKMCQVLEEHLGIALSLGDFVSKGETDDEGLHFVNPLNCIEVRNPNRLLVVTCLYVLGKKKKNGCPVLEIDPESVEFCVIESLTQS